MKDYVNLSKRDLINLILFAQEEGRKGRCIKGVTIMKPRTTSQNLDCTFGWVWKDKLTASDYCPPVPTIIFD
jgi:hypothetical protein